GKNGGGVGGDAEAGRHGKHHDARSNALAEHRPLGRHRVDMRVEPIARQSAPVHDVRLGDGPSTRALRLADLEFVVGPIQQKPIHPPIPRTSCKSTFRSAGSGKSTISALWGGRHSPSAVRTTVTASSMSL